MSQIVTLPLTVRYTTYEAEIRGDAAALEALAGLVRGGAPSRVALRSAAKAAPYEAVAAALVIAPSEGPIVVSPNGDEISLRGGAKERGTLAGNVEAAYRIHGPASGDHVHIEYYDDHPYLAAESMSLVIVLDVPSSS